MGVSGLLDLRGGTTLSGTGVINANGGLSIGDAGFNTPVTMASGILNNMATGTISYLNCSGNAVINNALGATLSVGTVTDRAGSGTSRFNNAGTVRGGGISIPFYNSGTVEVASTFSLAQGASSGSFQVATGAVLSCAALSSDPGPFGSLTFMSGSTITGGGSLIFQKSADVLGSVAVGGNVSIIAGTVNFAGAYTNGGALRVSGGTAGFNTGNPITLRGLVFSGGTLAGSDPLSVIGPMTWTGGTLKGPGLIEATAGLTMGGGTRFLDGRTLRNANAATWNGGFMFTGNGSIITNAPGAVFDIGFDGETFVGFGGARTFANAGVLRKISGSGTATISDAVLNTGRIESRSGTLAFGNTFIQTTGTTLLNGGDLAASGTLQIQGGTLSGDGTVTANIINSGQCAPGLAAGLLRVNGDYAQTSVGQLNIELGATTFDRLQVSGAASLAGTLNVNLFFHPALGQEFRILTFASRSGDFNPYTFSTTSELTPRYDATGLTLLATNAAPALLISRQPPNLLLSWPTNAAGYMLQYSTNLPATSWIALYSTNNSQIVVPAGPRQYFRLAKP
jgi:hypothetical protein